MTSALQFWNRSAKRYAQRPVADQVAYEKKLAITQRYLNPDMRVLEFGCGTGSTALQHAPHVQHYLAIDLSPAMIEIARHKTAGISPENVQFEVGTLESHAHAGPFDAVLGLNILHLLEQPQATVATVFSMLAPGGIFVSSTACLADTRRYLKPVLWFARQIGLAPPVTFLSRRQLDDAIRTAGFTLACQWTPDTSPDNYFVVAQKPHQPTE